MQLSTEISGISKKVRAISRSISNVLVPNSCLLCDVHLARHGGCCPSCWSDLAFIQAPVCPVMGTPFSVDMGDNFLSAEAIANPPPFDRLRAVLSYDEQARRLVSLIKYSDRTDLVPWISKWMWVAGKQLIDDADVVLPVPLHPSRLRKRRFNQAGEMARCLGKIGNLEYNSGILHRRKATRQQVGLTEKEREKNVAGAFVVPEANRVHLKGKRVLLIDDVYTTGATVKAATRALKRGGASNIDVLVFSKVETDPS
ncbi:MAG: ComF family protein [Pseudomonadota bacterium]